ncbi:MAG: peptidase domain-containing ABC transporter [Sphingomonas bacterium]
MIRSCRRYQSGIIGEDGLACLAVAADQLGERWDYRVLRSTFRISSRGLTAAQLLDLGREMNLAGTLRPEGTDVAALVTPAVVIRSDGRFALLASPMTKGRAQIFDPLFGWRRASLAELQLNLTGEAVEVRLAGAATRHEPPRKVRLSALLRWNSDIRQMVLHVIVISLFLQAYVVASPLYLRYLIDDVIAPGDANLLTLATVGFGLLAVFNTVAAVLRACAIQSLNNQLSWDMTSKVFGRLLTLPLQWFQGRLLADTLGRLQDVEKVRGALASLSSAVFDALLAAVSLLALFWMSPMLTAVALAGIGVLILIRVLSVPAGLDLGGQAVMAGIAEQAKRMEAVRAIQTIKAVRAEEIIESDWRGRLTESLRTSQKSMLFGTVVGALQALVGSAMTMAAIYLGARGILAGTFTVGMLTAILAYLGQFTQSSLALFQQLMSWRMLAVQLDRIGDIILEPSPPRPMPAEPRVVMDGARADRLRAERLTFRYAPTESAHLDQVELDVAAGEHVAIVGPSGCGKSTFLKLLTGLYTPESGQVFLNDRAIETISPAELRRTVGVVMQDDHLLTGTVAENVALFASEADPDRIWESLEAAGLADEVKHLPRGLKTSLGDMGATLSGGQKQRLLIARALYRRPSILVLDEATSHLDPRSEARIIQTLRDLRMTRITVAHRPDVAAAADRVLRLDAGRLVAAGP